jgi:hypothetical protein
MRVGNQSCACGICLDVPLPPSPPDCRTSHCCAAMRETGKHVPRGPQVAQATVVLRPCGPSHGGGFRNKPTPSPTSVGVYDGWYTSQPCHLRPGDPRAVGPAIGATNYKRWGPRCPSLTRTSPLHHVSIQPNQPPNLSNVLHAVIIHPILLSYAAVQRARTLMHGSHVVDHILSYLGKNVA